MRLVNRLFSGERPKIQPRNLQDNEAQLAIDCELSSTGIRALRNNRFIRREASIPATIYHFDGQWLTWPKRVSVAETPTGITTRRLFWSDDGPPRQATLQEFIQGRSTRLGVPTPTRPIAFPAEGEPDEAGSTQITTLYTVSFVNRYGDEGDMSLPSNLVRFRTGQTIRVTGLGRFSSNAAALSEYDAIVAYRLYRLDGEQSRFVTEQPITVIDYDDDTGATLGEIFQTQDYVPPPPDMRGIHVMANGVGVGFVGKTVYMSEPNQLNAWPHSFVVRHDVVAVSSFDNTLVIGTTGYPEVAAVFDPRNVVPSMLTEREPCVSAASMVQGLGGVLYAAPTNLFYIGPGGGRSLTNDFMGETQWGALDPPSIHAVYRDGEYYAFHRGSAEGGCWIFDTRESNAIVRRLSQYAHAAFVLQGTDDMYIMNGRSLELLGGGTARIPYRWRSKEHGLGNPVAMTCLRVLADEFVDNLSIDAAIAARQARQDAQARNAANLTARAGLDAVNGIGGAINQDVLGGAGFWTVPGIADTALQTQALGAAIANGSDIPLPADTRLLTLRVKIIADNAIIDDVTVQDEQPVRIRYADRARRWSYEITGEVNVSQFDMAGSQSELHYGS